MKISKVIKALLIIYIAVLSYAALVTFWNFIVDVVKKLVKSGVLNQGLSDFIILILLIVAFVLLTKLLWRFTLFIWYLTKKEFISYLGIIFKFTKKNINNSVNETKDIYNKIKNECKENENTHKESTNNNLYDEIVRKKEEAYVSNKINDIRKLWILEPAKDGEVLLYFYDNSIIFTFYSYGKDKVFKDEYNMTDTKNIYYNSTYGYLQLLDNNEILEITPREEKRYSKVINKIDFLQYEFITEDDPLNRKVLLEEDILNFLNILKEKLPISYPHNISLTQITYHENIITLHMTHNEERGTLDNSLRLKKELISMFLKTNFVKDCIKLKKDIAIQVYSKEMEHLFTDSMFKTLD